MQYLLDWLPPPASAGSCSRFLGIVHVWWVTVLAAGPGPAGHYGIGEATDLYLLGFYPVTSGLCCGTVHHPGGGKNKSLLDSVAMSLAKQQPRARMRALIKNPIVFLSSATSFVVLCVDSSPRPGPGVLSRFRLCGQWPVPVHPATIRIWVGSDIHEPEATRALADSSKLISRYSRLAYNPHHKKHHSWLPANTYRAFTSSSGWSWSKGGHG